MMPRRPSKTRFVTRDGTVVPIAPPSKLATGSPEPWKMRENEYTRAVRTYYVQVTKRVATRIANLIQKRKTIDPREILAWKESFYALVFQFPLLNWINASVYVGDGDEHKPHIAIEMRSDSMVLDWDQSLSFQGRYGQRNEPPLYQDLLTWMDNAIRGQDGADRVMAAFRSFDRSFLSDLVDMFRLIRFYARDRGYQVLIENSWSVHVLDPSAVTVVRAYPDGVKTPRYRDLIHQALDERPEEVSDEIALCAALHQRERDVSKPLESLQESLGSLSKIMLDLRQVERSERQDLELDYLGILTVRKMYQQLADINIGLGRWTACKIIGVARNFPLPGPGVTGLLRPPGKEDWPDYLVELSLHPMKDPNSTLLDSVKRTIESMVESNKHGTLGKSVESTQAMNNLGNAYLRWLLADLRWPTGRDRIEVML